VGAAGTRWRWALTAPREDIEMKIGVSSVRSARRQRPLSGVCHERTNERRCDAVREMRAGPSKPAIRRRLQTTASCDRKERWW
jgi:hypothetical protein